MLLPGLALLLSARASAQTAQSARDADRGSQYYVNAAAASAATEKVLAQMNADFLTNGQAYVDANLAHYSSLVPSASDNSYWTNFMFLNPLTGATNSIYILPSHFTSNSLTSITSGELQGLMAYQSLYSIQALAQQTNNSAANLLGGTELDVSLATVPLFEFAIFYNSLLEFTTAGSLTVQGPVHANSNIYVGSANPLTFNGTVTTTGVITNPAWAGDTPPYAGPVNYNGTPPYMTGQPAINLSFGANSSAPTNMIQIIYPPPTGESISSAMGQQRYYNKAGMVIMVSNTTFYARNTVVTIKFQSPNASDASPMWFTNINPTTFVTNATWTANNFDYWLSTTNSFYDFRQNQFMRVTQINVSNFNIWCYTNPCIYTNIGNSNKFNPTTPLNIIYVGDWRATNTATNAAVRLMGGGSANFPQFGLTVATPDPLYVWGNYDTPSVTNFNSTNVIGTYPTSFICDAFTILSANWLDSYTIANASTVTRRPATSTTVNGAIIAGVVYSTGPGGDGTTQYSGGVHNMPRMLENWSDGSILTLNTSLVNLYPSQIATAPFVWPADGTVYGVPSTRQFYFNQNYTTLAGLPPGTPLLFSGFQRVGQKMLGVIGNNP